VGMSVPAHLAAMQAVWGRLKAHSKDIGVLVVENGMPTDPASPLASWRPMWSDREWLATAGELRRSAPPAASIVLARLPLLGQDAAQEIARTAASAKGIATAVCAWVALEDDAEGPIEAALHRAQAATRAHGLELWLDAACPGRIAEPERTIRFLRLLAVCHQLRIPLTWWNGDDFGTLDRYGQHTRLSYAAQAWQSLVSAPVTEPSVRTTDGGARIVRWVDAEGRPYVTWWKPGADPGRIGTLSIELPPNAVAVDPLHAQKLDLPAHGPVPLCSWPLVARGAAGP
jgi:hypothetical protein